jgi:hypothetical protein
MIWIQQARTLYTRGSAIKIKKESKKIKKNHLRKKGCHERAPHA